MPNFNITIMKKIFTTLLILFGFYSIAFAQQKGSVDYGINVGYNGSYVTETNSNVSSDYVSGFNAGAYVDSYFSNSWSLKVKVNYDQKGWGNGFLDDGNGNSVTGVNFKLNYITIPVLANWHFGRTRNWYLNFGPYVGILTGAKESTDDIDVKQVFNTTDFGLDLGIGVKIPLSNKAKLFFEYDGQGGVTNIFKDSDDGSSVQNVRTSINVGLNFNLN